MITRNSKNLRILALICFFGSQQTSLIRADFKEVAYSFANQALLYKEVLACLGALLGLYAGYKAYIYSKVYRAETILDLQNITASFSTGFYGSDLFIRGEAMARVFKGIKKESYWGLEKHEQTELSELVANRQVIQTLIARQELSLIAEITNTSDLYLEDTYHQYARTMLQLTPPTQRNEGIGIIGNSKKEKDEAFQKLSQQQRQYVGLKTFCEQFGRHHLDLWQQHSPYLKDDLKQIALELKK